jgi:hypothetical protein
MSKDIEVEDKVRCNKDGSEWTIKFIYDKAATCSNGQFTIQAFLRNIHTDGKPRKSGFSLIKGETK